MAPEAIAIETAASSGPFGSTTATRSTRPMPACRNAASVAAVCCRSAACDSDRLPGASSAAAASLRPDIGKSRSGRVSGEFMDQANASDFRTRPSAPEGVFGRNVVSGGHSVIIASTAMSGTR